jgi:hypothetical protein
MTTTATTIITTTTTTLIQITLIVTFHLPQFATTSTNNKQAKPKNTNEMKPKIEKSILESGVELIRVASGHLEGEVA